MHPTNRLETINSAIKNHQIDTLIDSWLKAVSDKAYVIGDQVKKCCAIAFKLTKIDSMAILNMLMNPLSRLIAEARTSAEDMEPRTLVIGAILATLLFVGFLYNVPIVIICGINGILCLIYR